jgi:hypothetical protein
MKRSILWLVLFVVFIAAVAVVARSFIQEGYVRENILKPLSYGLWIGSLMLRGTPQVLFWSFVLLVAFVLAARSLSRPQPVQSETRYLEQHHSRRARLRFWVRQILLSRDHPRASQLSESLARLAVEVLAHEQNVPAGQMITWIEKGEIDSAELIQPFMLRSIRNSLVLQRSVGEQIRVWIEDLLMRTPWRIQRTNPEEPRLEKLVDYLEEQLDLQ